MCSTLHEGFSGKMVKRKVKEASEWRTKQIPVSDVVAAACLRSVAKMPLFSEGSVKGGKTAVYCMKCQVRLCLASKNNCFKEWHDGQVSIVMCGNTDACK